MHVQCKKYTKGKENYRGEEIILKNRYLICWHVFKTVLTKVRNKNFVFKLLWAIKKIPKEYKEFVKSIALIKLQL